MALNAPMPQVGSARQFFDKNGKEFFVVEAKGRRPDVPDALRALGTGSSRVNANLDAVVNWKGAWRSLHPALRVADKA